MPDLKRNLPEPESGQVWGCAWKDTILRCRLGDIDTFCIVKAFKCKNIDNGKEGTVFYDDFEKYPLFYLGAFVVDLKPESAVGQVWGLKTPGDYAIFPLVRSTPNNKCFFNDVGVGYMNEYIQTLDFIGWFDTTNMVQRSPVDLNKYPHKCPRCQNPAYIGFNSIDCSNKCKG